MMNANEGGDANAAREELLRDPLRRSDDRHRLHDRPASLDLAPPHSRNCGPDIQWYVVTASCCIQRNNDESSSIGEGAHFNATQPVRRVLRLLLSA